MRYVSLAFVFGCVLCLAACGGDESDGGDSIFTPRGAENFANEMEKLGKEMQSGSIELTDELMEEYVKIATEIHALGEQGKAGHREILKRYGWTWGRWSAVLLKVQAGMAQTASRPNLEKTIETLEKQIEAMKARPGTEQAVKGLERNRDALKRTLEDMPELDDVAAKNQEVLDRWLPKLKAIGE